MKKVAIICPKCKRMAFFYDGTSIVNTVGRCIKCNKYVKYNIKTGVVSLKNIPKVQTSSAMRF